MITHFNRPEALMKCIESILLIKSEDDEIIVSDDASEAYVIDKIKEFKYDNLIGSNINKGLAANINKGVAACKGKYIIYCQEDFMLDAKLKKRIYQLCDMIDNKSIDMIRFSSYFKFNKLIHLNDEISVIPRFHWKNFLQNFYRYSDHPFIARNDFWQRFGFYQENTSGRYGETEYGVRLANSKATIAITHDQLAHSIEGTASTLATELPTSKAAKITSKKFYQYARSLRLYFEWLMYTDNRRGLITYKNARLTKND